VEKGLQHAYRSRRLKKRQARELFVLQISAGAVEQRMNYSTLIHGLRLSRVGVDRKILSQLAQNEPYSFRAICDLAKGALANKMLRLPNGSGSAFPDEPSSATSGSSAAGAEGASQSSSRSVGTMHSKDGPNADFIRKTVKDATDELSRRFDARLKISEA